MSIVIEPEAIEFAQNKLKDLIENLDNPYFKSIHIDSLLFESLDMQILNIQDPKDSWYNPQQQRHRYDTFLSLKCTGNVNITGGFTLSYDYPTNMPFLGLPIELGINLQISIIIYLNYIDNCIKFSIRGISNLETGLENIVKSCVVESKIGDATKLKNLKSIENFFHILLEQGIKDEMGYPNYYDIKLPFKFNVN
eukprot:NODE_232_length_13679_cov_0.197349.p8 type:complete len:195 gc:universal NODE_232_length_13679_cov_0.197349:10520-9936(-)